MSKNNATRQLCFEQHNGYGGVDFDGNPWPFGYISLDGPIKEPVFELQTFIERDHKELDAIVRLMTAAPDMLEALKALHERYVLAIGNEGPEAWMARQAIAKAEAR